MKLIDRIKEKYNEVQDKNKELKEAQEVINEQIREVVKKERADEAVKTAIFKEQYNGEKKREFIKNGGWLGSVTKGFDNLSKNMEANDKQAKSKTKGKSKKQDKEETIMDRMNNFKLDMPEVKF